MLDMRLAEGCTRKAPLRYNNNWELEGLYIEEFNGGDTQDTTMEEVDEEIEE
jgi:hypothetical protein